MSFQSDNLSEVGVHDVELVVSLTDYPRIRRTIMFELEVLPCQVQTIIPVKYPDQTYNVYETEQSHELQDFILFPACDYTV